MAAKTYAQLATTTTFLDADLIATYSNTGPLKAASLTNFYTNYLTPKLSVAYAPIGTTVTGAGLATGGGAISSNQTITVTASTPANVRAGSSSTTATTPSALSGSAAVITLTDAATVTWDASTGYNATVTLGGNRTIAFPTNLVDGQTYSLELVQDATGSRVPSFAAGWDFGALGTPTLQTTAGKADKVFAQYNARTSKLDASFRKGA